MSGLGCSHQAQESSFAISQGILGLPLVFAPAEESLDGGPGFTMAGSPAVIATPQGVREADEGVDELETCYEATILVIRRVWGRGVCQGAVLLVGGGIGRPEPGITRILEHATMLVVLVMELVEGSGGHLAPARSSDWNGVGQDRKRRGTGSERDGIFSELAIFGWLRAKTEVGRLVSGPGTGELRWWRLLIVWVVGVVGVVVVMVVVVRGMLRGFVRGGGDAGALYGIRICRGEKFALLGERGGRGGEEVWGEGSREGAKYLGGGQREREREKRERETSRLLRSCSRVHLGREIEEEGDERWVARRRND